nr:homolog of EHV2 ORF20 nuclear protein UL24 [Macronycteris gammaherpesvirus 1]
MTSIFKTNKDVLSKLPHKRKVAGQKAHLEMYKKLVKYSSLSSLLKFLAISHPCPGKSAIKLFFEVSLGNRISDCVVLLTCGENRMCYIVELKTCMSNLKGMFNETRQCQRNQGLSQLYDASRFVFYNAPSGRQKWLLISHLIFKSQCGLKTIYTETPQLTNNLIHSSLEKLTHFFSVRSDKKIFNQIYLNAEHKKKMAPKCSHLVSKSKKPASYRQKLINRNKKICFAAQKVNS